MPNARKKDIWIGLVGILASGVLIYTSYTLTYPSNAFPLLVSWGMLLFSGLILGRALLFLGSLPRLQGQTSPTMKVLTLCVIAFLYALCIEVLGFYTSSLLCILLVSPWVSQERSTARAFMFNVVAACLFMGAIYIIMTYLLKSPIPSGMLM